MQKYIYDNSLLTIALCRYRLLVKVEIRHCQFGSACDYLSTYGSNFEPAAHTFHRRLRFVQAMGLEPKDFEALLISMSEKFR